MIFIYPKCGGRARIELRFQDLRETIQRQPHLSLVPGGLCGSLQNRTILGMSLTSALILMIPETNIYLAATM